MNQTLIRRAAVADIPALQNAALASWHATYGEIFTPFFIERFIARAYAPLALQDAIQRRQCRFVVADRAGQIVGFGQVGPGRRPGEQELSRLYVLPEYWRHGIGGMMLAYLEAFLVERGHTAYYCYVHSQNERGKAFYNAQGFVHDPAGDRDDEWLMRKIVSLA